MKRLSLLIVLAALATSCTANQRARSLGGTSTMQLPPGKKLVTASWKGEDSVWYLVRPMRADEQPETYEYIESSSLGIVEGKVVLQERR